MSVACPNCSAPLSSSLESTSSATKTACHNCHAQFTVGQAKQHAAKTGVGSASAVTRDHGGYQVTDADTTKQTKICPYCRSKVMETASKCPHCQEWISGPSSTAKQYVKFHPGTAAVLSFLIPGLGQIYKTQIALGFVWLILILIVHWFSLYITLGSIEGFLPGLALHVICIINAGSSRPVYSK